MPSVAEVRELGLDRSPMPRMNIGRPRPIDTVSPSAVEQADGEVERLVDDHVVGGAHEIGLHLFGHREHAVAHDLGRATGSDRFGVWRRAVIGSARCPDLDHQVAELIDLQRVARAAPRSSRRAPRSAPGRRCGCPRAGRRARRPGVLTAACPESTPCASALRRARGGSRRASAASARARGFSIMPITVARRLTISAGSSGGAGAVAPLVHVVEVLLDGVAVARLEERRRQVDRDRVLLADVAHVGARTVTALLGLARRCSASASALGAPARW